MKNNFHPRSWSTSSGLRVASSNANFNALRNGPLRNLGTAFITAARFSNNALGFTDHHEWNGMAARMTASRLGLLHPATRSNGSPATDSSPLVTE